MNTQNVEEIDLINMARSCRKLALNCDVDALCKQLINSAECIERFLVTLNDSDKTIAEGAINALIDAMDIADRNFDEAYELYQQLNELHISDKPEDWRETLMKIMPTLNTEQVRIMAALMCDGSDAGVVDNPSGSFH